MTLPPNVKSILPSLQVEDDRIATLAVADIKRQLPSLQISSNREDVPDGVITLSIEDLRKLFASPWRALKWTRNGTSLRFRRLAKR